MLSIVLNVIYFILMAYGGILFLNILFSWVPSLYEYKFVRALKFVGDWYMEPFRGRLVFGAIDFTPMVGMIIYYFIIGLVRYVS